MLQKICQNGKIINSGLKYWKNQKKRKMWDLNGNVDDFLLNALIKAVCLAIQITTFY